MHPVDQILQQLTTLNQLISRKEVQPEPEYVTGELLSVLRSFGAVQRVDAEHLSVLQGSFEELIHLVVKRLQKYLSDGDYKLHYDSFLEQISRINDDWLYREQRQHEQNRLYREMEEVQRKAEQVAVQQAATASARSADAIANSASAVGNSSKQNSTASTNSSRTCVSSCATTTARTIQQPAAVPSSVAVKTFTANHRAAINAAFPYDPGGHMRIFDPGGSQSRLTSTLSAEKCRPTSVIAPADSSLWSASAPAQPPAKHATLCNPLIYSVSITLSVSLNTLMLLE